MSVLDSFRLDDRVVIVTGASSGLGCRFAQAFAEAGADLVLGARRVEQMAQPQHWSSRPAGGCTPARPTSPTPSSASSWSRRRWPSSAGSTSWSTTPAWAPPCRPPARPPEEFRPVVDVNLNGSYWMAQACGRVMKPGSSIINIASVLGLTTAGLPQAAYSASKAGVIGLTRDLAQQWSGRKGIRVNALAPGFFSSEMTDELKPGYLDSLMPRIIMGRLGDRPNWPPRRYGSPRRPPATSPGRPSSSTAA